MSEPPGIDRRTLAVLAGLLLFGLCYRLLATPMLHYGDPVIYWQWARDLSLESILGTERWNHFTARYGVSIPVFLFHSLLGGHPVVYYAAPVFMSLALVVFLFLLCRRVTGVTIAALVCLCLIAHPLMTRAAGQIVPGVFSGVYVTATFYFVGRCYEDRVKSVAVHIVLAALMYCLAYLTRLPNLFFLPALMLAIWMIRRDWRDAALFLAIGLAVISVETIYYAVINGNYPFGRLSVAQSHLTSLPARFEEEFGHVQEFTFTRLVTYRHSFKSLGGGLPAFTFYLSLVGAVYLLYRERRLRSVQAMLSYALLSFVVINTFAITDVDPIKPVQRALARFWVVLLPFMLAIIAMAALDFGRRFKCPVRGLGMRLWPRRPGIALASAVLIPGLIAYLIGNKFNYILDVNQHPYVLLDRYFNQGRDLVESGRIIVFVDRQTERFFMTMTDLGKQPHSIAQITDERYSSFVLSQSYQTRHGGKNELADHTLSTEDIEVAVLSLDKTRGPRRRAGRAAHLQIDYVRLPRSILLGDIKESN